MPLKRMPCADLTKERVQKAKKLKLSITAGVGSDHVDLHAAAGRWHDCCRGHW